MPQVEHSKAAQASAAALLRLGDRTAKELQDDTDDAINSLQRLSEVDVTVIAANMGFTDDEIGELLGLDKRHSGKSA